MVGDRGARRAVPARAAAGADPARARASVWRALAFAVLLAWLAGPRLVQETRDTLPDIGLFVIDKTDSMRVGNRAALRDQAQAALAQQAAGMPDLEMRTVVVPESGHDGTALFAAIDRALADIPRSRLAGIVALTDGQVHDAPTNPLPAPLHVLIPAQGEETDRRLRIIEAPSFGLVGHSVTIRMVVDDLGAPRQPRAGPPGGPPRRRAGAGADGADRPGDRDRRADHPRGADRGRDAGRSARRARCRT